MLIDYTSYFSKYFIGKMINKCSLYSLLTRALVNMILFKINKKYYHW